MDQADGQYVKLSSKTIVSCCMGDPMGMGDPMVIDVMDLIFCAFFFTLKLLLMFLKILVPNLCVSMETCSMGTEKYVLELLKVRTFLNFSRTVYS